MVMKNTKLIFVYAFALVFLISAVSATSCQNQNYDSGWLNFKDEVSSHSSSPLQYGSWGDSKYIENNGWLIITTDNLGFAEKYLLEVNYEIGTLGQDNESFKIFCGNEEFPFPDSDNDGESMHYLSIQCNLSNGENNIRFKSTSPSGGNSIHFYDFKITGNKTCQPQQPVCGNGIVESGEECDGGNSCSNSCEVIKDNTESGHGNIIPYEECLPNWECSGWGECSDNVMTRTCVDSNRCEYVINEPYTITDCVDPVVKESKINTNSNSGKDWFLFGVIIFVILVILLVMLLIRG